MVEEEDTPHYLQPLEREEVWERLMDPLFRDSEETDVGYANARFSVEELEDSRRPLTDNERLAALENFCHGLRAPYLETFAFLEPEVIVAIYRRFFLRGCANVERWRARLRAAPVEPRDRRRDQAACEAYRRMAPERVRAERTQEHFPQ